LFRDAGLLHGDAVDGVRAGHCLRFHDRFVLR
jgi:hypothetical protein